MSKPVSYKEMMAHKPLNYYFEQKQPITEFKKDSQRSTILSMLKDKPRHCGEFMTKGIAQYNARIKELRGCGHNIVYHHKVKLFTLETEGENESVC